MNTEILEHVGIVCHYINGHWQTPAAGDYTAVHNPATGSEIARAPLTDADAAVAAIEAAEAAYPDWRRVPAGKRVQPLFKLKMLLEQHLEELARLITSECGKTLVESRGELQRAVENIETACCIPTLMQGDFTQDIARGIDEFMIRQPLGVCAAICPFNFPAMIPFWFLPYAIACGNTYIVKPSERVPATMQRIFELIDQTDLPPGVANLLHGGQTAAETLLDHDAVRAISFVGSTPVARKVYARATAHGKRAQCQGGAKNPVVIMPDCDLATTTRIVADSAFGCAGQRCLAASLAVTVGTTARENFTHAITEAATNRRVGNGLAETTQMGPLISRSSLDRLRDTISSAQQHGARILAGGPDATHDGDPDGYFLAPTVLDGLSPDHDIVGRELFGPVLGLLHVDTLDDAIELINRSPYGNMGCIFTANGADARKFRTEAECGNIGVNIGVAAPMAQFPFSGWKQSFFGVLHGQARHAVEFFTQTKVVVERWPDTWDRKF